MRCLETIHRFKCHIANVTFPFLSGLSIQPVSESASQLDSLVKEVEQAYRVLQEACSEVTYYLALIAY